MLKDDWHVAQSERHYQGPCCDEVLGLIPRVAHKLQKAVLWPVWPLMRGPYARYSPPHPLHLAHLDENSDRSGDSISLALTLLLARA